MAVNKAKQRMLRGETRHRSRGGLGSPLSAELISPLGFDYVLVDNQHGAWADQSSMHAFRSISLGTAVPMARVRRNDFGLIGRLLDMGCMGIVVPMVNNAEEAEAAVSPPAIRRSAAGPSGHSGRASWATTTTTGPTTRFSWAVQIETDEGARNAEEIMAVEGIDGCWIGPGDLSRYMRLDLNTGAGREVHSTTIRSIIAATQRAGKIPGISTPSAEVAQRWIDEGCLFVVAGWTQCGSWTRLAKRCRRLGGEGCWKGDSHR